MYILPKEEGRPEAGYWGYIVAVSKEQNHLPAMMESRDGTKWEALPPAKIEWGATPPGNYLEYGGCERINGKYYLIGGVNDYMGNKGYCMYTFVADNPRGPFRPDAEAFRLCGNSGKFVAWLAAWARGKDELLISNYSSMQHGERAPWMLALRKPVVDKDGHLRMGWWKGNEALKREPPLRLKEVMLNGEGKQGNYDVFYLDVTGKGCATVTGVEDGREHTFRLLCRKEMLELYIDDLLVQTYTRPPGSGKVGFLVGNAQAEFSGLSAWAMSFPGEGVAKISKPNDDPVAKYRAVIKSQDKAVFSKAALELRRWMEVHDPQRPTYHTMGPLDFTFDVNGPIYHDGKYHIFYANGGAAVLWSSPDLENWTYRNRIYTTAKYGDFWELPYLLPFGEKSVLIIGVCPVRYWVGAYDKTSFVFKPDGRVDSN
jgi:hypothetical protein